MSTRRIGVKARLFDDFVAADAPVAVIDGKKALVARALPHSIRTNPKTAASSYTEHRRNPTPSARTLLHHG